MYIDIIWEKIKYMYRLMVLLDFVIFFLNKFKYVFYYNMSRDKIMCID